jgi:predicted GNAT family acetyltransferase
MKVEHEETGRKGTFFVEENGQRVAELAYFKSGADAINIYHTEVNEKLRGKGVGEQLVKAAADMARQNDKKILATCPYAHKVMDGTPEYRDLLTELE